MPKARRRVQCRTHEPGGLVQPDPFYNSARSQVGINHLRDRAVPVITCLVWLSGLDLSCLSYRRDSLPRVRHDSSYGVSGSRQLERGDDHARIRARLSDCVDCRCILFHRSPAPDRSPDRKNRKVRTLYRNYVDSFGRPDSLLAGAAAIVADRVRSTNSGLTTFAKSSRRRKSQCCNS